jgi:FkbM family methyltransferase
MLTKVKFNGKTYLISCYGKVMNDYISSYLIKGQFYEEPLLKYLSENYKPKKVIDIGANIGNHSLFFNKVMGAEVVAFEPIEDNFRHLAKNNPGTNYNVGLGKEEKEMGYDIGTYNGTVNMGGCTLTEGTGVQVKRLDSYNLETDLIKIDAENMEVEIIEGGIKTIIKNKPVLVIEHNDIQKLYSVARLLIPLGYIIKPFVVKDWEVFIYEQEVQK